MISVLSPTCRLEGLKLVEKALKRQTEQSFEWVIGSRVKPENLTIPFIWVQDPPKEEGLYWTVYRSYNLMLKASKGDLIVSWQDYTYADPTALEKFLFHFNEEPKTLVTAVGGKYADETWSSKTWQDPRERTDSGSYYQCKHNDIEWNLAAVPKEAIYAVGGFDEYMDKFSSLCGLDVLERLNAIGGYDFKIDQTIKSYSTEHGRLPDWDEKTPFKGAWGERIKYYIEHGPVLDYLN